MNNIMKKACFNKDIYSVKTPIFNRKDIAKKYLYEGYQKDRNSLAPFLRNLKLKKNKIMNSFNPSKQVPEKKYREIRDFICNSIFKNETTTKDFICKIRSCADINQVIKPISDAIEKNRKLKQDFIIYMIYKFIKEIILSIFYNMSNSISDEYYLLCVLRDIIKEQLVLPDSDGECFIFTAISGFIGNPVIDENYSDLLEWIENNKKDLLTAVLYEFVHILEDSTVFKGKREAYFTLFVHSRIL